MTAFVHSQFIQNCQLYAWFEAGSSMKNKCPEAGKVLSFAEYQRWDRKQRGQLVLKRFDAKLTGARAFCGQDLLLVDCKTPMSNERTARSSLEKTTDFWDHVDEDDGFRSVA